MVCEWGVYVSQLINVGNLGLRWLMFRVYQLFTAFIWCVFGGLATVLAGHTLNDGHGGVATKE